MLPLLRTTLLALSTSALLSSMTAFAQTAPAPRAGAPRTSPPQTAAAPQTAGAPQTAPAPQAAAAPQTAPAPQAVTVPQTAPAPQQQPGPLPYAAQPPQQRPPYPPPSYAYPSAQQGYAPPFYSYPARLDYTEGKPIPAGYHKDVHVRRGLIIGGAVTFGVLYTLSLIVADTARVDGSSRERRDFESLYIPCIGPFIMASRVNSGSGILIVDGLAQTGGVIMFISGFAFPRTELVRNDLGSIRILPLVGQDRTGVSLVGSF